MDQVQARYYSLIREAGDIEHPELVQHYCSVDDFMYDDVSPDVR